jgi:ankyrin repeat protein
MRHFPDALASRSGLLHIVEELLNHRTAINAQNTDLFAALHLASAKGHIDIMQLLIQHRADVDARNKG